MAPSSKKRSPTPVGSGTATATAVEVDGRRLRLTNLDKVLYPATGFTKGQVVDYYARIAPVMPSGRRTMVTGRSWRWGSITGAIRA